MDLTTRCPHCGTVFAASLQQLQLRKGYVRCISCAHIFDGYEAVVGADDAQTSAAASAPSRPSAPPTPSRPSVRSDPPTPPASFTPPAPSMPSARAASPAPASRASGQAPAAPIPSVLRQRAPGAEGGAAAAVRGDGSKEPVIAGRPIVPPEPRGGFTISSGLPDDDQPEGPVFHLGSGLSPAARPTAARPEPTVGLRGETAASKGQRNGARRETAGGDDFGGDSIYVPPRRERKTADAARWDDEPGGGERPYSGIVRVFWGVLIVAGLLLLLAQLVYIYRAQIANNIPMLRPTLEQACVPLHCTVAYERRIDAIAIMSSSLRAGTGAAVGEGEGKAETGNMTLQLTLRNTYDRPQEWPTLVLDLTDFSGTLVVRKNLRPEDYLGPELSRKPFAAGSELTVTLPVSLGGLQVNGYQLSKFFQ